MVVRGAGEDFSRGSSSQQLGGTAGGRDEAGAVGHARREGDLRSGDEDGGVGGAFRVLVRAKARVWARVWV